MKLYLNHLELPVLPENLKLTRKADNKSFSLCEYGEVTLLKPPKPVFLYLKSFFPAENAPYVSSSGLKTPEEYIKFLDNAMKNQKVLSVLAEDAAFSLMIRATIEELSYEERGGEPGDIYYELTLKEYRQIPVPVLEERQPYIVVEYPPQRPVERTAERIHTVVRNDCLWDIAQKYYGNGRRYPEIYKANKELIDARNRGHNVKRYTIYIGQKLLIP